MSAYSTLPTGTTKVEVDSELNNAATMCLLWSACGAAFVATTAVRMSSGCWLWNVVVVVKHL
jgi:hypothetical protein